MIECRRLSNTDLDDISTCITHHNKMYGVIINHTSVLEKFKNNITNGFVFGAYLDNTLKGVCTQTPWPMMPVWTLSNLFVINNPSTLLLSDQYIKIIGSLMEATILNAEQNDMFEFYYVIRDSRAQSRKQHGLDVISESNNSVAERYSFTTMHVLNSESEIKWQYIKSIIGDIGLQSISPPYNKTLNLRRATIKDEYRNI